MTARWFDPKVAMLMSVDTSARDNRYGRTRPIVIVERTGTVVRTDFMLPADEFRPQACKDFLAGRDSPYLRRHPELVAEFKKMLGQFEQLATR